MDILKLSPRVLHLKAVLTKFVEEECLPNEELYESQIGTGANRWKINPPILEHLKTRARSLGLWNLFLPKEYPEGAGLTVLEYATLAEITGRSHIAPEACNCSAPDTGNMEVFAKYGTKAQKDTWLKPLLEGKIRSAYLMTEPYVASSDATNIETEIKRDGDYYVVSGRKWWSSGAMDPRCKVLIVMGKTDKSAALHSQQSMIIVPMDAPGVKVIRHLEVFGWDDAPHGHAEVELNNVRVPVSNILLGEGRGFEISQGRLGPGRIHHCMRAIGLSERCLELMIERAKQRKTFGKLLIQHGTIQKDIADCRIEIDTARLLVLQTAAMIDTVGVKNARKLIAMIKIIVPNMACNVADKAIQVYGGAGVCQDTILARAYAGFRTLRIADGPDEVHRLTVTKLEVKEQSQKKSKL